ncbi:uncharacterized protein LOC132720018 [Ruditapes philippinarum]|uniref:uncharacterized protein LOC132720018 n=1 Tax=Ruditapes philippinarum TaxID=129788 RepID=UPI00295C391A|nr:uncharacterized protein LOC132720018 [Ruditapes philippinarum]
MSTTGTERHCRLCLMLNQGGPQACHHLLLKRVKELSPKDHDPYPWTIQQFLDTKKQTIIKSKLSKDKFKILFPNDGDTVLTNWDLALYCTVLTLYCDLKPIIRLDVEQLRNLRNELCHMNEPNISVSDYKDKLEMIQVIICRLVKKIDEHNVKIEIENVIKSLESATLSLDETLKEMHAFYMMEMDIREKLDHVEERILQRLEQFDDKWEFISKVLGEKEDSRINTATNNGLVPGVNIFLDLKNVNDEEEENMSDVLQQLFDEVIHEDKDFKSSIPADSYVRLRGAIEKTFKRFLSKGWRITRVKHECIQLHIECTNFTALAALFREQTQGLIDQQLTELNEALTECVSEKMLLLETTIYTDELWNVIDKAISCVEGVLKEHNIDMATQSDNAQLLGDDIRKHSLSLSAEKVGSDGSGSFEGDCNYKLETFLQLLKAELKSEFHTPNLLIQANCSTNVNHESNDSSIGNKVELPEENTQTIRSDHQSPKFDKKRKGTY